MTQTLNYGTNVEIVTTDHLGNEETINLVVERELKESQPDITKKQNAIRV